MSIHSPKGTPPSQQGGAMSMIQVHKIVQVIKQSMDIYLNKLYVQGVLNVHDPLYSSIGASTQQPKMNSTTPAIPYLPRGDTIEEYYHVLMETFNLARETCGNDQWPLTKEIYSAFVNSAVGQIALHNLYVPTVPQKSKEFLAKVLKRVMSLSERSQTSLLLEDILHPGSYRWELFPGPRGFIQMVPANCNNRVLIEARMVGNSYLGTLSFHHGVHYSPMFGNCSEDNNPVLNHTFNNVNSYSGSHELKINMTPHSELLGSFSRIRSSLETIDPAMNRTFEANADLAKTTQTVTEAAAHWEGVGDRFTEVLRRVASKENEKREDRSDPAYGIINICRAILLQLGVPIEETSILAYGPGTVRPPIPVSFRRDNQSDGGLSDTLEYLIRTGQGLGVENNQKVTTLGVEEKTARFLYRLQDNVPEIIRYYASGTTSKFEQSDFIPKASASSVPFADTFGTDVERSAATYHRSFRETVDPGELRYVDATTFRIPTTDYLMSVAPLADRSKVEEIVVFLNEYLDTGDRDTIIHKVTPSKEDYMAAWDAYEVAWRKSADRANP